MHQPFDDVLNYESFSLRLSVADVPNLMSILKAISPAEIHQYRLNMWVLGLWIARGHIMHQMKRVLTSIKMFCLIIFCILSHHPETLISHFPNCLQYCRHKVYKAFHWVPEYGGQAYNYTMLSLRRKLQNLWGVHYKHRRRI